AQNNAVYEAYRKRAQALDRVIFGGRLGEYKYYDMDKTIEVVLSKAKEVLGQNG
ncbi:MAG: UDP-galactopyranose mutase, partial [Clostridia bacterium]|nr:UDP-galactopyranose mutase [Clostridia bacterium]